MHAHAHAFSLVFRLIAFILPRSDRELFSYCQSLLYILQQLVEEREAKQEERKKERTRKEEADKKASCSLHSLHSF